MTVAVGHLNPMGLSLTHKTARWKEQSPFRQQAACEGLAPALASLLKLCCSFHTLKGAKNKAAVTWRQRVE